MKLPTLPVQGAPGRLMLDGFGGLDMSGSCSERRMSAATNMSGDHAPMLAPRARRGLLGSVTSQGGATSFAGKIVAASGGTLTADGETVYTGLEQCAHTFCEMSGRLVVLPEKLCVSSEFEVSPLEAEYIGPLTLSDGTYAGESAKANTLTASVALPFKVGDAITITGMTNPGNNRSAVVREVSEDAKTLRFYENTFTLEGSSQSESAVTLSRSMPELDFICACENRLWGCSGDTIYACALGDPFNWNRFEGLSTDSYAVQSGSAGEFTACTTYMGYPTFFKRDAIYKVYGSSPSKYQLMASFTLGVEPGSAASLAVAGETLYYLSRAGFVAYTGGEPSRVSDSFGTARASGAVAGSDGVKYYVSCALDGQRSLYVLDTRNGEWYREDSSDAAALFMHGGALVMLTAAGGLVRVSGAPVEGESTEEPVTWEATLGECTLADTGFKRLGAVELRLSLAPGASVSVALSCDGGEFETVQSVAASPSGALRKLRIVPRRCDRWQLRLSGAGEVKVGRIASRVTASQ